MVYNESLSRTQIGCKSYNITDDLELEITSSVGDLLGESGVPCVVFKGYRNRASCSSQIKGI